MDDLFIVRVDLMDVAEDNLEWSEEPTRRKLSGVGDASRERPQNNYISTARTWRIPEFHTLIQKTLKDQANILFGIL